jgi:hypothetical protein
MIGPRALFLLAAPTAIAPLPRPCSAPALLSRDREGVVLFSSPAATAPWRGALWARLIMSGSFPSSGIWRSSSTPPARGLLPAVCRIGKAASSLSLPWGRQSWGTCKNRPNRAKGTAPSRSRLSKRRHFNAGLMSRARKQAVCGFLQVPQSCLQAGFPAGRAA